MARSLELPAVVAVDEVTDLIGTGDILEALAQFGYTNADFPDGCGADVDGDGVVSVSDLLSVLSLFGLPC